MSRRQQHDPSFNPRAREGRDQSFSLSVIFLSRFNPRAREGRDYAADLARSSCARFNPRAREGRDAVTLGFDAHGDLFQSTRPRGARRNGGASFRAEWGFQSTRPRGARPQDTVYNHSMECFNPRAREGRDPHHAGRRALSARFQSTRPRGARQQGRGLQRGSRNGFNPRAREGRDLTFFSYFHINYSFNPRAREGRDSPRLP